MKKVSSQNPWNFELSSHEKLNALIWINVGFQRKNKTKFAKPDYDTFCRLPVISAQCTIGTENYLDAGILLIYDDNDYSKEYG